MRKVFIFLWVAILLLPSLVFSQDIYVSTTGNDANIGSSSYPKQTINAGIAAAMPGGTVFIAAGTYAGCTLNKSVNLQGQGIGVIIQGSGSGNGIDVTTNISGVTISNLSITNFQMGINFANTASTVTNLTLNNVSSSGNTTHGFYSVATNFDGLTITNCEFNNNAPNFGRGIWITGGTTSHSNIIITNSQFDNNGLVGFDLALHHSLNNLTITGCQFLGNGDSGIAFYEGHSSPANSQIVITNNVVEMVGNSRFGIEVKNATGTSLETGAGRVLISDNRIYQSSTGNNSRDFAGIAVICRREGVAAYPEPSGVVIKNNLIENIQPGDGTCGSCGGNVGDGFGIVAGGNNHRILYNTVSGCEIGIQLQGGNVNAGTANSSPSTTGHANTLYFDRDNSTTANGNIARYNNIISYTGKAIRHLQNSNFLPNDVNDYTGNWLGSATFALADIESRLVSNAGTAPNFLDFASTANSNAAFNPWAAVDLDDTPGNASGQRGVQIGSSKIYRATATEPTTSIGVIPQGILIANTAFKDILDIRTGAYPINANVSVNKAIHLLGNGGSGTSPTLTMVVPCESILVAAAPNITIEYLHLQVNGAGGTATNGRHGIFVDNHGTPLSYNNLEILRNLIENINPAPNTIDANAYGIRLSLNPIIAFTSGHNNIKIENNIISVNPATQAFFGRAIRSIGNFGLIQNNSIQAGGLYGIQWGDISGDTFIQDNTISSNAQAGIELNIPLANTTHTIQNNILSVPPAIVPNSFSVIEIKDNYNANAAVNILNNTITGHPNAGIFLGRSSNVNIVGNTFTPFATSTTYNHIIVSTKNRTAAASAGPALTSQNISIRGNNFQSSAVVGGTGISFANHHSGAVPAFSNITIGTPAQRNQFGPNMARFIALDPYYGNTTSASLTLPLGTFPNPYAALWTGSPVTTMASVTENFNAVENEFDVGTGLKTPATMTNPELILLENRIQHTIDYGPLGFVTVKPNHVFVTQQSFIAPAFTTEPRIRRGTNVINVDGFTLNVEEGAYNDDGSATDRPLTAFNTDFVPVGANPVISKNWEMNGFAKTLNLLGDLTIDNQVIFNDGFIQTNANTLNFTPVAIDPAANPTTVGEKADSRILGRARTIRNVGVNAYDFLGLNLPAGADLGILDLLRVSDVAGIVTTPSGISIACTWHINPSTTNGRNGVEFRWLPAINNGKNVTQLQAWRYNGTVWEPRGPQFSAPSTFPLITSVPINVTQFSPWTISDVLNPLPVELLTIKAYWNARNIPEVEWQTAAEIQADYFDVERSYNATDFVKIGTVLAKGNNSNYVFEDKQFSTKANVIYYRLRQIDKNGKFTYSRVVSVGREANSRFVPKVYPNPTSGTIFVEMLVEEPVVMRVVDMYGKEHHRFVISATESKFDVGDLSKGVYFLQFETKNGTNIIKLAVQ